MTHWNLFLGPGHMGFSVRKQESSILSYFNCADSVKPGLSTDSTSQFCTRLYAVNTQLGGSWSNKFTKKPGKKCIEASDSSKTFNMTGDDVRTRDMEDEVGFILQKPSKIECKLLVLSVELWKIPVNA